MPAIAILNAALTDRYRVERELGEGGMEDPRFRALIKRIGLPALSTGPAR